MAEAALSYGRFALPRSAAVPVGATARRSKPTQTLDRTAVSGYGRVHVTAVAVRCGRPRCASVATVRRPDFLRLGYGVDVLLPGRQRLLQRQLPRTVRLLFAQTVRTAAAAVRTAQTAGRRHVSSVRKTPQKYAAVGACAHHRSAVRTHLHVGHDAGVPHPDVRRNPLVV